MTPGRAWKPCTGTRGGKKGLFRTTRTTHHTNFKPSEPDFLWRGHPLRTAPPGGAWGHPPRARTQAQARAHARSCRNARLARTHARDWRNAHGRDCRNAPVEARTRQEGRAHGSLRGAERGRTGRPKTPHGLNCGRNARSVRREVHPIPCAHPLARGASPRPLVGYRAVPSHPCGMGWVWRDTRDFFMLFYCQVVSRFISTDNSQKIPLTRYQAWYRLPLSAPTGRTKGTGNMFDKKLRQIAATLTEDQLELIMALMRREDRLRDAERKGRGIVAADQSLTTLRDIIETEYHERFYANTPC